MGRDEKNKLQDNTPEQSSIQDNLFNYGVGAKDALHKHESSVLGRFIGS